MEENISTLNVFRIGPRLAELLSILENKKFYCKIADYHAVVWEWSGSYAYHIGSINESCFILTSEKELHPTYAENICTSYDFNSPREDDSVCLGLIGYDHEKYQNITDGKITFYNDEKERLVKLPYEDIMYGYIDSVITYLDNKKDSISSIEPG